MLSRWGEPSPCYQPHLRTRPLSAHCDTAYLECSRPPRSPSIPPESLVEPTDCFGPTAFFFGPEISYPTATDERSCDLISKSLSSYFPSCWMSWTLNKGYHCVAATLNFLVIVKKGDLRWHSSESNQGLKVISVLSHKDMVFEVVGELSYCSYGREQPAIACRKKHLHS